MYINALRKRFGCHLPVVELGTCEIHDPQRQTFENVFLIYMTASKRAGTESAPTQTMGQRYEDLGKRQKKAKNLQKK